MASLDWSQCPAVESVPGKVSCAWVFRGTRVPVSAISENLKTSSLEEVLENFHVTREQVQIVLEFAPEVIVLDRGRVAFSGTSAKLQGDESLMSSLLGIGGAGAALGAS